MSVDTGLLVLRLFVGIPLATHGAQKLFGWFGGYGLKGTGGFFESIGFRPGVSFAALAGLSELGGGLLLAVGLLSPFGAAAVLAAMLVATISVHWKNGFYGQNNGYELAYLYGLVAVVLAITGSGKFALDSELGLSFVNRSEVVIGALVLAVVGAAIALAVRRVPEAQATTT